MQLSISRGSLAVQQPVLAEHYIMSCSCKMLKLLNFLFLHYLRLHLYLAGEVQVVTETTGLPLKVNVSDLLELLNKESRVFSVSVTLTVS